MSKNCASIHRRVLSTHACELQFIPRNKHFAPSISIFELAQNLPFVKGPARRFSVLALRVILLAAGKTLFVYALRYHCGPGIK